MSKKSSSLPEKTARSKSQRTNRGCLIFAGIFFLLFIIALGIFLFGVLNFFGPSQSMTALSGLDDNTSPEVVAARREQAEARLNSYGWVDKEAGVVRIPIDQAMALIVESGLPVGTPEPEEITPEPDLPPPSPTVALETDISGEAQTPLVEAVLTMTPGPVTTDEAGPTQLSSPEPSATPTPAPTVDLTSVSFQENVLPILERSCGMCHGGDRPEGGQRIEEGLILLNYEGIMAGSWNGSVLEPGDVEDSYLIEQIATGRMPKEGNRLTPAEVELITAWVEAGALDN